MKNIHYKRRYYPTLIDIPTETRTEVIEILNQTLATNLDLKTQVKQACWSVKGINFYQLHELFDEIASELEEFTDLIAERITALGGEAMGTARIAATHSMLEEYPFKIVAGADHVTALVARFAIYARLLRQGIDGTTELGDADTADLYTQISRTVDKRLWFLEAHLQTEAVTSGNNRVLPLQQPVPEQTFIAANQLKITVKQIAPYSQKTDLQIVCFFKHKAGGDTVLSAIAELDKKLGGMINSLRNSGQFIGDELETITFVPPAGSIQPKRILLIGLGDEQTLSLEKMHRIGTVALREAVKLKASHVSFAPALRDQGNASLSAGDVAPVVVESVILAYDTEKRLQKQGLAQPFTLEEWVMEAGANFYEETLVKVQKGIELADSGVTVRDSDDVHNQQIGVRAD